MQIVHRLYADAFIAGLVYRFPQSHLASHTPHVAYTTSAILDNAEEVETKQDDDDDDDDDEEDDEEEEAYIDGEDTCESGLMIKFDA